MVNVDMAVEAIRAAHRLVHGLDCTSPLPFGRDKHLAIAELDTAIKLLTPVAPPQGETK